MLEAHDLRVTFNTQTGRVPAVRGVSFQIGEGETVGLVGESGSGKSVTAAAVVGLLDRNSVEMTGALTWNGRPLPQGKRPDSIAGSIGFVPQDPGQSLNPYLRVGRQIADVYAKHHACGKKVALREAVELLSSVGFGSPDKRARNYPHQLSGGMRQRVQIALALASDPKLIVADEPTTALDVTIQAQIVELLAELRERRGLSVLFISHDLGVVSGLCDSAMVMYCGRVVEMGPVVGLFSAPRHHYTRGLLGSRVDVDSARERLVAIPGAPPNPRALPTGCAFEARCQYSDQKCREVLPELTPDSAHGADAINKANGQVACWHPVAGRELPDEH